MPKRYSMSEDFELWISRFESYSRAAKVAEGNTCDVLLAALDDDAFTAVNSLGLSAEVLADYTELTAALKKRFAPTTSPFELRFHLRRCRQKDGETFDAYAEALKRQAIKAFPDLAEKARLEVIRDQFIEGLHDECIQERLLQEAPETMEKALKLARQLGAAKAAQKSLKSLQPVAATTVSSISEGFDLQQAVKKSVQEVLKDYFPAPTTQNPIADTLEALSGSKYFSTMDLSSGYWQVGMHPKDQYKMAFTSHRGLFEFRVLPFGLCNAPATFERLMEFVLAGLIGTSCLVYLDDIVIFSRTFEEHLSRLTEVLTRLRQAGLKLKPAKCFLFRKEIIYLGHVVSKEGIATDPSKTAAMDQYPTPKNIHELKQFIGFASYYRRFIPKFAEIAAPLHRLTQKSVQYVWTEDCQRAFENLKQKFTKAPVLAFPQFDIPF